MARHIPVLFLVVLCLTSGAASAQVAMGAARAPGFTYHPPPPKPERPAPAPEPRFDARPAPGGDLFRAGPDTYTPKPGHSPYLLHTGYYPTYATPEVVVQRVIVERTKVVVVEVPQAQREPEKKADAPAPEPPVRTAMPKTIYVIPRCYAGDTPPQSSRLPAGCDVRNVRVIPAGAR